MWRALLGFLVMLLTPVCMAQVQDSTRAPAEPLELRTFDAERINELKADPALDYDRDVRRVPTLWERFKEWLASLLNDLFGNRAAGFITRNLLYVLVVVLLVFAVLILGRGGLRRVFYGASRSVAEVTATTEDIREMDLGTLIAEAEKSGDLRRALRLHYLLVLRKLVDQGVLQWSPDHTDRDYMAQIADPGLRSRFTRVALVFQWVWYGHAEVEAAQYAELRKPFVEFETVPVA